MEDNTITVTRPNDAKENRSLHGLTRTLINNMIVGVTEGYKKELDVNGVGYRVAKEGNKLVMNLGFSHQVIMEEKNGVTIVLEALNSLYNHKGYYLDSSYVGFEIMKAVDCPNVKLLFDCYHMQLMEGNLVNSITTNIDYIGHFHSAGVPGRHELHKGETNYPFVIKAADDAGYDRYFGFEYWPTYDNKQSLTDILNYVRG
jgi:hydroxypyruvate isomerase